MGLSVRFVENLEQVVQPVAEYLTTDTPGRDLFDTEYIVVPNAGVRAWLLQKLAHTMGSDVDECNGVIGNFEIGFIGMLDKFVSPNPRGSDPWAVEFLTFAVLRAIADLCDDIDVISNIERLGGGLKAARTMADRFDRYHARRPHMIRCWEAGRPELSPYVGEDVLVTDDGELDAMLVVPALNLGDHWQFTLWRRVRELIGMPSPPARTADALQELSRNGRPAGVPSRVAVIGIQSLSSRHIETIRILSRVTEVTVLLVHPSPELAARWSTAFAGVPVAPGIAVARPQLPPVPDGVHPLVWSWLRGSMDLQHLLAVNGFGAPGYTPHQLPAAETLLGHMKRAVASPSSVRKHVIAEDDQSFLVHRAHNLARQVEVLHDALLHAFDQIPGLQPHEVVIISPDIANAAPHLQAVFNRTVTNKDGRTFELPLVIADRGLREYDEGARLLVDLVTLLQGRFGIGEVLDVITSPLVLDRFGLGDDDVETWRRYMERTRVRWGLDDAHRSGTWGVNMGAEGMAHTWTNVIRRSLLGATLPDTDSPRVELGGTVPVVDVEPGEIGAITALAEIMHILGEAQSEVGAKKPVAQWCALLELVMERLVADSRGDTDEALFAVNNFLSRSRVPAAGSDLEVDVPVEFSHLGSLVAEQLTAAPGRQPLRTGAITATSMIPLRSVPFRVVCVVGLDDGVYGSGETEGDDIESRQHLIGDADARLEQRRALLDAVVAAQDRLIITCIGRNVKNNVMTPLVTPLAELVELCEDLGVARRDQNKGLTEVEIVHPRHFNSTPNFVKGQLVPGITWSHSESALEAARNAGNIPGRATVAPLALEPLKVIPLELLEQFVKEPLTVFLRNTLEVSNWKDNRQDDPAVIPLSLSNRESVRLAKSLMAALGDGRTADEWEKSVLVGGELPPGEYRTKEVTALKAFVGDLRSAIGEWGSVSVDDVVVRFDLGDGRVITGTIPNVHKDGDGNVFIMRPGFSPYDWVDTRAVAPLHMLLLSAMGQRITDCPSPGVHDDGNKASRRNIRPEPALEMGQSAARVATLVDLLETARSMPCPSFDGAGVLASTDRDAASEKFQSCVEGLFFSRSDEAFVYGFSPYFEDVFPEDSPLISFWATYAATVSTVTDGGNYVPKRWRRYFFS